MKEDKFDVNFSDLFKTVKTKNNTVDSPDYDFISDEELKKRANDVITKKDIFLNDFLAKGNFTRRSLDVKNYIKYPSIAKYTLLAEDKKELFRVVEYFENNDVDYKCTNAYAYKTVSLFFDILLYIVSLIVLIMMIFSIIKYHMFIQTFTEFEVLIFALFAFIITSLVLRFTIKAKRYKVKIKFYPIILILIFTLLASHLNLAAIKDINDVQINAVNEKYDLKIPAVKNSINFSNYYGIFTEITFNDNEELEFIDSIKNDDRFKKNITLSKVSFRIGTTKYIFNKKIYDLPSYFNRSYDIYAELTQNNIKLNIFYSSNTNYLFMYQTLKYSDISFDLH